MEKKRYEAPGLDVVRWLANQYITTGVSTTDPTEEDTGGWDNGWS